MATLSVWPALGTTVTLDDLTVITSAGASVTYTAEIRGLIASAALLTYDPTGGGVTPDPATGLSTIYVTTLASLATVRGSANGQAAFVGGDAGGMFVWDSASTDTSDSVTIIGSGTGRWERVFTNTVYAVWWSPAADGVTDDAAILRAAVASTPSGGDLVLESGATYFVGSSITGTAAITIRGNATLKKGSFDGQVLKIYGLVGTYLSHVVVDGVSFDGNDSGLDYSAGTPNHELSVLYTKRVIVNRCKFVNTRQRSLNISTCTNVDVVGCRFEDGAPSSGSADATTTSHLGVFTCTNVSIEGCAFKADITYDAGDKTQAGMVAAAPIAIIGANNEYVTVHACKSYDAGNVELYEANRNVTVTDCQFDLCHLPAVKLGNSNRVVIKGNTISDSKHWWGASIQVACYTRLTSYGCLRPYQGQITISNNVVTGAKSEYGAIFVLGAEYSTTDLDTRIADQGSYGYTTTNIVVKTGPNYAYTDFDGTVHPNMSQSYLLARNVSGSGNVVDGFATTGFYGYLVDNVSFRGNTISNAASIDTTNATTKACIKLYEFLDADVSGNVCTMPSTTTPTVSGASSSVSGVMATTVLSTFRGVARLKASGNTIKLTKAAYGVYVDDLKYVSVQDNDFAMNSYVSAAAGSIVARGNNRYGIISGNQYWVSDTGTVPSASTEYDNLAAHFMSLDWRDDRRSVERSRRVVSASTDYTTPTQVASGYYSIGSEIAVAADVTKAYYRCTTAGWLAPAYAGGTTYTKGAKSLNGGEYFASLQDSNTGHTPTAGTGDSWWEYLGTTAAVFSQVVHSYVLTGSATYDPGNLVDGAGATTTVTVTGAALGDYAEASHSLDTQGITITAWVSATNTVSVRFQNESGGDLDIASGTLRARVVQA